MEKRNDGFTQHIHLTSVSLRKWEVFNSVFIFYPSGFSLVYSSLFKLVLVHSAHFSSFYPGFSNAYRVQFLPRMTSLPVHTFIGHLHFFWNKKEAIFSSRLIDQPNELDGLGGTVSSSSCNHDTTVKSVLCYVSTSTNPNNFLAHKGYVDQFYQNRPNKKAVRKQTTAILFFKTS